MHWDDRKFPGSIRATIHQKKEPVLGLRIYPGYKRDSRLLPYHGVTLVTQDVHGGIVMRIEPEINVVGRDSFQRYISDSGVTDLYLDTKVADR